MYEFAVGDIVHIMESGPDKEKLTEMGFEFSQWPDDGESFFWIHAGETAIISQVKGEHLEFGGEYRVSFEGTPSDEAWFGQDFQEFYDTDEYLSDEQLLAILNG